MKFPNKRAEVLYRQTPDDQAGDSSEGIGWAGLYLKPNGGGGWILFESTDGHVEFDEYHDDKAITRAWLIYQDDLSVSGEPDEEDYVIQSVGRGGEWEVTPLGLKFESDDWDQMVEEIKSDMERRQFWPNVWVLNDHGNFIIQDGFAQEGDN